VFGGRRVFTRRAEALCRAPLLRYPRYPLLRYPRYARAPRYICTLCPADFSVAKNAAGSLLYACARYIPARCVQQIFLLPRMLLDHSCMHVLAIYLHAVLLHAKLE